MNKYNVRLLTGEFHTVIEANGFDLKDGVLLFWVKQDNVASFPSKDVIVVKFSNDPTPTT